MKDTPTNKEPNPGGSYIRIYVPPETQLKLERIAQDYTISRGKLITQIIEHYINEPEPREKQDEADFITKDDLNVLLEEIRAAKKVLNTTELRVQTLLTEPRDTETETQDVDALIKWSADNREERRREHSHTIFDIIGELEGERGEAPVDKVIKQAGYAGIREDEVKQEITHLLQTSQIYEPVYKPGTYRVLGGPDARLAERSKTVLDVIAELEREEGEANINKIEERATKAGFSKEEIKTEITRLMQMAEIHEPIYNSGNYLTVLRMQRTQVTKDD